jgi:hypothetical protein
MDEKFNDAFQDLSEDLDALFAEVSLISGFIEGDSNLLSNSYSEELERQHQKLCILSQRL